MQSLDQLSDRFRVPGVETSGRLVGHQNLRFADQRSGQGDPLALDFPLPDGDADENNRHRHDGEPRRPGMPKPSPVESPPARFARLVTFDGLQAGFLVDSASELLKIPRAAIGPAPELSDEQVRLISRVANLGERMILIVDAPELLDRRELGLLRQMAGAGAAPASS